MTLCPKTGKISHRTPQLARQSLRSIKAKDPDYHGRVYFCRACDGWHFGSDRRPSGEIPRHCRWLTLDEAEGDMTI